MGFIAKLNTTWKMCGVFMLVPSDSRDECLVSESNLSILLFNRFQHEDTRE